MYFIIGRFENSGHGGRWTDTIVKSFETKEALIKYLSGQDSKRIRVFEAKEMEYSIDINFKAKDRSCS
jgi:hypothetical protein